MTLAGVPLLRQDADGLTPRSETEIRRLIGDIYGHQVNFQRLMGGLQVVARALRTGQITRALIAATQLGLPALDEDGAGRVAEANGALEKAGFDPNEPRDWRGRWTTDGSEAGNRLPVVPGHLIVGAGHPDDGAISDAAQNTYHNQLVRNLANYLRDHGCTVLTEVPLTGVNGVTARADMLVQGPGGGLPDIVEVKTGVDPQYTEPQRSIYPLAMVGGHITSWDVRVKAVGLTPGKLFPPLPVLVLYQKRPGSRLRLKRPKLELDRWAPNSLWGDRGRSGSEERV